MSEVAKEASQKDIPLSRRSLVFVITCSDDDMDIPFIQYRFR